MKMRQNVNKVNNSFDSSAHQRTLHSGATGKGITKFVKSKVLQDTVSN